MKRCECGAAIGNYYAKCPLCGCQQKAQSVVGKTAYPRIHRKSIPFDTVRTWVFRVLVLVSIICGIVNLSMGGRAWSLYVLLIGYLFYQLVFSRELIEAGFIQKFMSVIFAVCILLLYIELRAGTGHWATDTAIPVIYFGALFIGALIYFLGFKHKHYLMSLVYIILGAMIALILGLAGIGAIKWPIILLASFSGAVAVVVVLGFRKPFWAELKKRLHV